MIINPTEEDFKRVMNEDVSMTSAELIDKYGTDDIDLINAGKESEERVELKEKAPEYDFISEGDVRNTVWVISDEDDCEALSCAFADVPNLYIADGHHRAASAVKVALKRREENPGFTGEEEFNFFLSVAFKADELKIMDYNRVIKDKNGLTSQALLGKLSEIFTVEEKCEIVRPDSRHSFGFYCDKKWYKLTLKEGLCGENDPLDSLDVSVLQKYVISGIFGIDDPRTDKRIDFVGGIRGLGELERRAKEDMCLAFSMYPTTLKELMDIADAGQIMPPKSTWFEPKLLSGLFIHKLK
jgi:uncharacterized protein (DUF1015 family)